MEKNEIDTGNEGEESFVNGGQHQRVRQEDLSGSVGTEGPKAPVINNAPQVKELTEEEKATGEVAAKEAADKEAADKAAAEQAAAEDEAARTEAEQAEDAALKAELEANQYPEYGDESADAVTAILKNAGVSVEDAYKLFGAKKEGHTPDDIDVAGLTEKLGKENTTAVLALVKDFWNRKTATTQASVDHVYALAGGKEAFERVAAWAKAREAIDPAFKADLQTYRLMFDAGKLQAGLAAKELLTAFNADPKNKTLQVKITHGDKSASEAASLQPLTRNEYLAKYKVAQEKNDHAEMKRISAARALGRQQGI